MRDHDAWRAVGDGLPTGEGVLRYVLAAGTTAGEFFAAANTGLYRTTDAGDTWTPLGVDWPRALESTAAEGMAVLP
jgi:photosystem II stability/assembly factor-like uncharacterized protein